MILPGIKIEKKLIENGTDLIVGVDEAGRGPLAGPVVAGAAWIKPNILERDFEERSLIRDSKMLSEKQREKVHKFISKSDNFLIGIGEVSEKTIDRINILNATFLAMRLAVDELFEKIISLKYNADKSEQVEFSNLETNNAIILVDGNKGIPKIGYEQKLFPKGDQNIFSIAVASICAKVHRDQIMLRAHERFPEYGFDSHKGYGTKQHMDQLDKHGPCKIHRRCFAPIGKFYSSQ